MSELLVEFGLLILKHGYDALMLLLACCQTGVAVVALRPAKLARVYPLRLNTQAKIEHKQQ